MLAGWVSHMGIETPVFVPLLASFSLNHLVERGWASHMASQHARDPCCRAVCARSQPVNSAEVRSSSCQGQDLTFAASVRFSSFMLPRGLRPLATEDFCRPLPVVTLLLTFTAFVTSPHPTTWNSFTGAIDLSIRLECDLAASFAVCLVNTSHSTPTMPVQSHECESLTPFSACLASFLRTRSSRRPKCATSVKL